MFPLHDDNDCRTSCGVATNILIVLNLIVIAIQPFFPALVHSWALNPHQILLHQQSLWNLVSHCFVHTGYLHLIGNLWYLYIFGDNVEDKMGSLNFFAFYLCCGVLSGLAEILMFGHQTNGFVGASGAISGVMAAYMLFYPENKVRTFIGLWFYIPRLPSWILIGSFFVMNLLACLADPNMIGGVSYIGHIAGFAAGAFLAGIAAQRSNSERGY